MIAEQFCKIYSQLDKHEERPDIPHYSSAVLHESPGFDTELGLQLAALLNFDDQKQAASLCLGREGGLEEFLSIVYTGDVVFLTDEAKLARALDLLSGSLTEEILKEWPVWRLLELLEFLYFRIRALERSRRLPTTFIDPTAKKKPQEPSKLDPSKQLESKITRALGMARNKKPSNTQPFSAVPDLFYPQSRKPTWKLVQDHGVSSPTLVASIEGYLWEAGGDYSSVLPEASTQLMVQDADLDINYYEEYFARKVHHNYVTFDEGGKGNVILSMVQCEDDYVRILLRTFDEDVRLKSAAPVKIREMLKNIRFWYPSLANAKWTRVKDLAIEKTLLNIEHNLVTTNYKFGVLYCKEGQTDENDMFGNEHGSDDFNEFLEALGDTIELKDWDSFRGGLDHKKGTTGELSVYTDFNGYNVMYHVSTMLPFSTSDAQQLERKRHLGNDVVVVIFKEGDQPFSADCLCSEFNHVFVVVQKVGVTDQGHPQYKIEISCKDSVVQPWRPLLPNPPIFTFNKNDSSFHDWLLTKFINGERACMYAASFVKKFQRTRQVLFQDIVQLYSQPKKV